MTEDKGKQTIIIKNIYYMLSYAFRSIKANGVNDIASEDFENIHDLFAEILIRGITPLTKGGLQHGYIQKREALSSINGRINDSETSKQLTLLQGKIICDFDEFAVDILPNQILKSAVHLLIYHADVTSARKKKLKGLLMFFDTVSKISPTTIQWNALRNQRMSNAYKTLINFCRFVINGLLLTTQDGKYKLTAWIQDGQMEYLYEKFVFNYYEKHHPCFNPERPYINWNTLPGVKSRYLPTMRTDIVLTEGERQLIIDTKYYRRGTMQSKESYHSKDLYQMYAYVKNYDINSTGNVAGMLLYAMTDERLTPDEDIVIAGNRISLKTLNLNSNWQEITEQLDQLCGWLRE